MQHVPEVVSVLCVPGHLKMKAQRADDRQARRMLSRAKDRQT